MPKGSRLASPLLSSPPPSSSSHPPPLSSPQSRVVTNAAARPVWKPGTPPPAHLDGSLPGDYGFDPCNLGANPAALRWYAHAELIHGRTAMMAAAGILGTSVLHAGGADVPSWFDAGKVSSERTGIPGGALFVAQMIMYHFVEIKRLQDFKKPGSQAEPGSFFGFESAFKGTGDKAAAYPGGPMFDPLGLGSGPSGDVMKLREVKNGRLAMLATLGFAAQYAATGKDPLVNLAEHVRNPALVNFATNGVSLPFDNPIPGYL